MVPSEVVNVTWPLRGSGRSGTLQPSPLEPKNSAEDSREVVESLPPVSRTPNSVSSGSDFSVDRKVSDDKDGCDVTKDGIGGDLEAVTRGQPPVVLDGGGDPGEVLGHLHVHLVLALL